VKDRTFSLQPFPGTQLPSSLQLTGSIIRRVHTLDVHCTLAGELTGVVIPRPAYPLLRKHGLWKETCFEIFLAVKGAPPYWEFNLSPAGHWNVYSFTSYREGMREEAAFTVLPFRAVRQGDTFQFAVELDPHGMIRKDETIEAAPCAVIRHAGGEMTHWALAHQGPAPDFHRRDSFTLELA
jgi:hypothetical protein